MSSLWHPITVSVRRRLLRYLWSAWLVLAAEPVLAHHSYSMFDFQKPVTLNGTVYEFQWSNPHTIIALEVQSAGSTMKRFLIETQSPSVLMRLGWKFNSVKKGDKVKIMMFPLRDGLDGGALYSIELPGGQTMKSTFPEDFIKSGKFDHE